MKRLTVTVLALLAAIVSVGAQGLDTLPEPYENRELPRTQTISYASEDASIAGPRAESSYFQPLAEGWSRGESRASEYVSFTNKFKRPFAWADRQIFVYIGSTTNAYEVWVNGEKAGSNLSAATAAEFDVTKYAKENVMNDLEIRVSRDPVGWIGKGAGINDVPAITGDVYVLSQPRLRVRDYVADVSFTGSEATVQLGIILKSHLLNPKNFRVFYKLLDPKGDAVAEGYKDIELKMRAEDTVRFFANVRDPRPWSPATPDLYKLLVRTQHEGRYPEYVCYETGLRNVSVSEGMLNVNGAPVTVSAAEYGQRLDSEAAQRYLEEIKSQGFNAVKLTGAPQPPYFYAHCDRLGLYVCDQADINTSKYGDSREKGGNPANDPARVREFTDRAIAMYYTSRNHPSVVMFSIADDSSNGFNLYESYRALKAVEPSRPIVYMEAAGEWNSDAVDGGLKRNDPTAAGDRIVLNVGKPAAKASAVVSLTVLEEGYYRVTNGSDEAVQAGVSYTIKQGKKLLSEGVMPVSLAPGGSESVRIPVPVHKGKKPLVYDVRVR